MVLEMKQITLTLAHPQSLSMLVHALTTVQEIELDSSTEAFPTSQQLEEVFQQGSTDQIQQILDDSRNTINTNIDRVIAVTDLVTQLETLCKPLHDWKQEARRLYIGHGNKIAAIKYCRSQTGMDLFDAKRAVEALG